MSIKTSEYEQGARRGGLNGAKSIRAAVSAEKYIVGKIAACAGCVRVDGRFELLHHVPYAEHEAAGHRGGHYG